MTEEYDLLSGISCFDGVTLQSNNLKTATSLNRDPNLSKMDINAKVAVIAGVVPYTTNNNTEIVTARHDAANKDIGIGIYEISRSNINIGGTYTTTQNNTVLLTPAAAPIRTFMTGILCSLMSNVTCDDVSVTLNYSDYLGNATSITPIGKLTLTATSQTVYIQLSPPIQITDASNLTFAHVFTAGASMLSLKVFGYKTLC